MGTARFIKTVPGTGDARLYELSEPLEGYGDKYTYVVVSATIAPYSGPETYIFGANKDGDVLDWGELEGSFQGALDHAEALSGAGYDILPT